ncbi:MAG: exopolyphosphatase [Alphaproteobacteria bacterium]|nr:exopolyphosphatase [Alphaproteobacteria bacterium]
MQQVLSKKHRLITRIDFDGLVCAILLSQAGVVNSISFAHPRDIQHKFFPVTGEDILANLPYHENALLVFDNHPSEKKRIPQGNDKWVIDTSAPSTSRIIFNSFDGVKNLKSLAPLVDAADKVVSADFTLDDILDPQDWVLLSFLLDARTGLGRFKHFRATNTQIMLELVKIVPKMGITEIMKIFDIQERVELYRKHQQMFTEQLMRVTTAHDRVAEINLLRESQIWVGNRFMVYALFPMTKMSMHVLWGKDQENIVFACGASIFNKDISRIKIGDLMLAYGGGGYDRAGTCQLYIKDAERARPLIIQSLNEMVDI